MEQIPHACAAQARSTADELHRHEHGRARIQSGPLRMRHERTLALRLATSSTPCATSTFERELPHSRLLASRRCDRCLPCKDARASSRWRNFSRKQTSTLRRMNWQESQRGISCLNSIRRISSRECLAATAATLEQRAFRALRSIPASAVQRRKADGEAPRRAGSSSSHRMDPSPADDRLHGARGPRRRSVVNGRARARLNWLRSQSRSASSSDSHAPFTTEDCARRATRTLGPDARSSADELHLTASVRPRPPSPAAGRRLGRASGLVPSRLRAVTSWPSRTSGDMRRPRAGAGGLRPPLEGRC